MAFDQNTTDINSPLRELTKYVNNRKDKSIVAKDSKIPPTHPQGILLVDKQVGSTSFRLVSLLRKLTGIRKIGHAGTLDPFATGLMVMLVGQKFTKLSDQFLTSNKQYLASIHLGITTDSYDCDGVTISTSDIIPNLNEVTEVISKFQGEIEQTPPMFSAKKVQGQKLYELARKGIVIERAKAKVNVQIQLLAYEYPKIDILVDCSKGTYIRSLAYDIGQALGCGAHLSSLTRTKSGSFSLDECIAESELRNPNFDITPFLKTNI